MDLRWKLTFHGTVFCTILLLCAGETFILCSRGNYFRKKIYRRRGRRKKIELVYEYSTYDAAMPCNTFPYYHRFSSSSSTFFRNLSTFIEVVIALCTVSIIQDYHGKIIYCMLCAFSLSICLKFCCYCFFFFFYLLKKNTRYFN